MTLTQSDQEKINATKQAVAIAIEAEIKELKENKKNYFKLIDNLLQDNLNNNSLTKEKIDLFLINIFENRYKSYLERAENAKKYVNNLKTYDK